MTRDRLGLLLARDLIEEVRRQFRFYEENHRAKGTPDGDTKAAANAMLAEKCEKFLRDSAYVKESEA